MHLLFSASLEKLYGAAFLGDGIFVSTVGGDEKMI
jgi:hypothetical protein